MDGEVAAILDNITSPDHPDIIIAHVTEKVIQIT